VGRNGIPTISQTAGYHPAPRNNWQVEVNEPSRVLLHRSRPFGEEWLERRVGRDNISTYFFAPRGLAGFLYWYLTFPFRALGL
jgi:hypothetical protein